MIYENQLGYWSKLGYSDEESKLRVKNRQKTLNSKSILEISEINKRKNGWANLTPSEVLVRKSSLSRTRTSVKYMKSIRVTMETIGYWIALENYDNYKLYKYYVLKYTNIAPIHLLENFEKCGFGLTPSERNEKYHLDHKYSIFEGFKNSILPCYIGSIYNLEFLSHQENITKRHRCSIDIEDLMINISEKK